MKKLISLVLITCICFSCALTLASCGKGHTHSYAKEWQKDETHHWHACEGDDCSEISDKAAHTWDDGEVKSKATAESDGETLFTCTACGYTKTEKTKYSAQKKTTVSEEEWKTILSAKHYNYNVVFKMTEGDTLRMDYSFDVTENVIKQDFWEFWGKASQDDIATPTTRSSLMNAKYADGDHELTYYEITDGKAYRYQAEIDKADNGEEVIKYHRYECEKEECHQTLEETMTNLSVLADYYDKFEYDAREKAYKSENLSIGIEGTVSLNVVVYIVEDKVVKATFDNGGEMTATMEFEYGNTNVVLPQEYHIDSSNMDCSYWRPY